MFFNKNEVMRGEFEKDERVLKNINRSKRKRVDKLLEKKGLKKKEMDV
jgi:hypothetical protein